jgi:molybdate transport system ATP-binding protein
MTLIVDFDARAGSFSVSCRFDVGPGSAIALIGTSGAGKTTVLRAIAGLLKPERGRIAFEEELWFDAESRAWVTPQSRDCAMVFAEYALFGHMSVVENVAFGLRASGCPGRVAVRTATQALDLVGVASLAPRKASSLSSGEAQRVAIARALAMEPLVLLLDEPFSAIDVERRPPVRDSLQRRIAQAGIATVLVTHDPVEAMLFSDTIVVMEAGAVVQRGTPAELRERPLTSYVAAFAGVNLYRGIARPLADGVSEVDVSGATLVITGGASGPVALVIDPDSVLLSRTRPESSARNSLEGPVIGVLPDGAAMRVNIASVPPIVARVTKKSVDELGIVVGAHVYATFKASEVRVH